MLRLTKKVEYALIALLHMSEKRNNELTTAKELSRYYHIPQELMGKVLQQLSKRNFIHSVQGVKGGYRLEKPLEKVKISHVVNIVDGPIKIVDCVNHNEKCNCQQISFCNIKDPMGIIQHKLEYFFNTLTLKDLRQELVGVKNQ